MYYWAAKRQFFRQVNAIETFDLYNLGGVQFKSNSTPAVYLWVL